MLTRLLLDCCLITANKQLYITQPTTYLGLGVVGTSKVGLVALLESLARVFGKVLVIVENATSAKVCDVDALIHACVSEVEAAHHVGADHIKLGGDGVISSVDRQRG